MSADDDPVEPDEAVEAALEAAPQAADGELASMMRAIPVRVGAELGRARMPLSQAVDLGPGVVIELDRDAEDPIELTINGQPFATGQLMKIDDTEWAIRIERVLDVVLPDSAMRAAEIAGKPE